MKIYVLTIKWYGVNFVDVDTYLFKSLEKAKYWEEIIDKSATLKHEIKIEEKFFWD